MPADRDFNTALKLDLLTTEGTAIGLTDQTDLGWTGCYDIVDNNRRVEIEDIQAIQNLDFELLYISQPFAGRPDLLANRIYGNPELSWILKVANNLQLWSDFTTSLQIKVPNRRDVESLFLVVGR